MQESQEDFLKKAERQKVTCFSSRYIPYLKKIYPEFEFIPLSKALKQKKAIKAFITIKGRGTFIANMLGFNVWNIREGVYKLPGKIPSSFILEKFGSYTDARFASEWEDCVKSIPALFSLFKKHSIIDKQNFNEYSLYNEADDGNLTAYAKNFLSILPIAFPAVSPYDFDEVADLIAATLNHKVSTDHYAPDASPYKLHTPGGRKRIVIIDQVKTNKLELKKVFATEESFKKMILDAKMQHPGAAFFLFEPPLVRKNKKTGYLRKFATENGVHVITEQVSSFSILAQADEVYTVSSKIGLDAILLGKNVHCYGLPYYAGWGLTKDEISCERRNITLKKEELFAALCLFFTRYLHPITGNPSHFQAILHFILLQRPQLFENKRYIACINFNEKQKVFFSKMYKYADIHFFKEQAGIEAAYHNKGMVYTAEEPTEQLKKECGNIPLVYVRPGMFDRLYNNEKLVSLSLEGGPYPPLEKILLTKEFGERDFLRARLFRQFFLELSAFREHYDYSLVEPGQDVLVIIGNADLAPKVKPISEETQEGILGNLDKKGRPLHSFSLPLSDDGKLIEYIRKQRPDAYIIYCPQHSDTKVAQEILELADDILPFARPSDFVPIKVLGFEEDTCENHVVEIANDIEGECLDNASLLYKDTDPTRWNKKQISARRFLEKAHSMTNADSRFCKLYDTITHVDGHALEIHTYDSHLGIDALAIPLKVFTYGWPYYGGWGLTQDAAHYSLRTRKLSYEQVLAGAFIMQPRYFDVEKNIFCEPENAPFLFSKD